MCTKSKPEVTRQVLQQLKHHRKCIMLELASIDEVIGDLEVTECQDQGEPKSSNGQG